MKKFLFFLALNFFITLYYRAEHFRLFLERTLKKDFTFYDYLLKALSEDVVTVFGLGFLSLLLLKFPKIIAHVLLFFLQVLVVFYYASSLSYYKLYEGLLEISALRNLFSILPELVFSIQGELDDRLVNFLIINTTLVYLAIYFMEYEKKSFALISLTFLVAALPQKWQQTKERQKDFIFEKEILKNPILKIFLRDQNQKENSTVTNFQSHPEVLSSNKAFRAIYLPRQKYNVVFYFFESMAFKYLDFTYNGHIVTPSWNRLKKNSLFMKNHYANFPLSINSFFNVFCSLPALPDGRWLSLAKPDIPHKCAAEILETYGYKTAIFHAGDPDYAGQRRFYKYHGAHLILDNHDLQKGQKKSLLPWQASDERFFIEKALDFAEKNNQGFFITLFPFTPHHPYAIPEDFPKFIEKIDEKLPYPKKIFLKYLNSLYFADFVLGELIDQFEKKGLAKNTLFFIFADHGEAFYEHKGNFNHPYYLYQENVHVPFLIYNPVVFPKTIVVEKNTSHLDILPTLLDILNIQPPQELWGKSILKGGKEEVIFLQTFWDKEWLGLIYGSYKYLYRPFDGKREFYDLNKDPLEKNNLIDLHENLAQSFHELVFLDKKKKKEFFSHYLRME